MHNELEEHTGEKKPTKMIFEVNPCVKYLSTLSLLMPLTLRKTINAIEVAETLRGSWNVMNCYWRHCSASKQAH